MLRARLICSDTDCPDELEVEAETLAELESLACDCGCGFEVVGWASPIEPVEVAEVLQLPHRPRWTDAA